MYLDDRISALERQIGNCCCSVLAYSTLASFPITGKTKVIYIDKSTDLLYRWDGAAYVLVAGGPVDWGDIGGVLADQTDLQTALDNKQGTLISGTNIKTINSTSLLGAGDIAVTAAAAGLDTHVQFNDGGVLGGNASLFYNKTTNQLSLLSSGSVQNQTIYVENSGTYTGTEIFGNMAMYLKATGNHAGNLLGSFSFTGNAGAGAAVGFMGTSDNLGSGIHIATMGRMLNANVAGNGVGGYFDLVSGYDWSVPSTENAALYITNNTIASPIFIAKDNTTTVFKIKDGGIINIGNAPVYADDTAAGVGGLVTGDVYQTSAGVLMIKQ